MIDVQAVCKQVNEQVGALGFVPRDADGNDLHRPDHEGDMRLKIGTSYGEVAVQVWYGKSQFKVLRIINDHQMGLVLAEIEDLANPVVDVIMAEDRETPIGVVRESDL